MKIDSHHRQTSSIVARISWEEGRAEAKGGNMARLLGIREHVNSVARNDGLVLCDMVET